MRRAFLVVSLALLAAALVVAERKRAVAEPGAQSLLYLIADSERDLTTLPTRFTRIPDRDEITYGDALARTFAPPQERRSEEDIAVEQSLGAIGARLAPHAQRRLPYRIHYLPDEAFLNAFALPGGHVFVGGGLVRQMATEDELAAVIAHEIEHIDHFHCAERLQIEAAMRRVPVIAAASLPIAVFQAGYSKDQELEADREGVLLAARAGYSARGAVRAFEMLQKLAGDHDERARTPQEEVSRVAADVLTGYFRTHPPTADRLAQVRTMIARDPALAPGERPLAVRYITLTWESRDAIAEEKFGDAATLAARALAERGSYPPALAALTEADYGRGDYAGAERAYRELITRDSAAAGAVTAWVATRGERLAELKRTDAELALVASVLRLQPSEPHLVRLGVFAAATAGRRADAVAYAATLRRLYPDAAVQAAGDARRTAGEWLDRHDFPAAAAMAASAFVLDPSRIEALATLGHAEFAQAHFVDAADAYGKSYDEDSASAAWLRAYADALAVSYQPGIAPALLKSLLAAHPPKAIDAADVRIEQAGLMLIGGVDDEARAAVQLAQQGAIAPELLGRLASWYLRARRAGDAEAVLRLAASSRPGDTAIQNELAWTMLEEARPLQVTTEGEGPLDPLLADSPDVLRALVAWQGGRREDALRLWRTAAAAHPQWRNAAWRAAVVPPRAAALATQLDAAVSGAGRRRGGAGK